MKAMLVIDIDDNTDFEFYDVRVWCYNNTTGLHKWYQNVQLKPMPEKEIVRGFDRYEEGWNDCIDEILKEV
jgi:hypothetical protein